MKRKLMLSVAACLLVAFPLQADKKPLYKDAKAPIEQRVKDLLSRMTLDEKVWQLTQGVLGNNDNPNNISEAASQINPMIGSVIYGNLSITLRNEFMHQAMEKTRLGIPVLFAEDVIHGYRTIYPMPIGQGCSFNADLGCKAAHIAAKEGYASGVDQTFSPMIDISHDPRWGRIAESFGEDPYVNAQFCAGAVKGFQGDNYAGKDRMAACLKHFVGYGCSMAGHDYNATDISHQSLWDTYFPPYEAGVRAGALTLMSAFNDLNGTPTSANKFTLREVLKGKWNFQGFVVSDYGSVSQLIPQGSAADEKECTIQALNAGVDMDMGDMVYLHNLKELVTEGKVKKEVVDDACRRILRVKFQLGLFDNPYREEMSADKFLQTPENRAVCAQLAEESMVLLKNDGVLPLKVKTVAVVGPMADNSYDMVGGWGNHADFEHAEKILDGMKKQWGESIKINYVRGCNFEGTDTTEFSKAIEVAKGSDVVIACLGELNGWTSENASRANIEMAEIQAKFLAQLHQTGKPIVMLLSSGRPMALANVEPLCNAILEMWKPGSEGGSPIADLLTGKAVPSGKLDVTFPYSNLQIPIFYNHRQSARPDQGHYQDLTDAPLYEFGYGLSYTTFKYGEPKASVSTFGKDDEFTVSVDVTNTGNYDAKEAVLWFIRDPFCTVTRPVKELRFFEKKMIKKGETQTFTFKVNPMRDLSYPNENGERILEPGKFQIIVGGKTLDLTMK